MNPLHTLGYKFLSNTAAEESANPELSKLSRRGFMVLAASLSSCSAAAVDSPSPSPSASAAAEPVKTPKSTYRTPPVQGPVPRNPDQNLTSNFSKSSGISFSRVLVSGNYVAMTFDDGPHPKNTPRLLDILRARNIKATFFVIGRSVELYPQVVRRTVAEGHEIGNHTHTHRLLTKLSDAEVRQEFSRCRDAVGKASGIQPRVMRPPYGGLLQRQRELAHNEFGYPTILWSVDPLDWKNRVPSLITSRILSGTTAGGIVLSHDLHSTTVDAMPATLDGLLNRGFRFVTVSQLLAMKTETTAQTTVPTPAS